MRCCISWKFNFSLIDWTFINPHLALLHTFVPIAGKFVINAIFACTKVIDTMTHDGDGKNMEKHTTSDDDDEHSCAIVLWMGSSSSSRMCVYTVYISYWLSEYTCLQILHNAHTTTTTALGAHGYIKVLNELRRRKHMQLSVVIQHVYALYIIRRKRKSVSWQLLFDCCGPEVVVRIETKIVQVFSVCKILITWQF